LDNRVSDMAALIHERGKAKTPHESGWGTISAGPPPQSTHARRVRHGLSWLKGGGERKKALKKGGSTNSGDGAASRTISKET